MVGETGPDTAAAAERARTSKTLIIFFVIVLPPCRPLRQIDIFFGCKNAPPLPSRGAFPYQQFELKRCFLQLLQRAHLQADGRGLRRKPFVFARERVLTEALLLRRHILSHHLQQPRQRERLDSFLVD
jgi:hypothetical protein